MSGARRLSWAAGAGLFVYILTRAGLAAFLAAYACPDPGDWWPDWATFCSDDGYEGLARRLVRVSWDGALPLILGAGTFAVIGWGPRGLR